MSFDYKTLSLEELPRPFVKYQKPGGKREIKILRSPEVAIPTVSIIIPTLGPTRAKYLNDLIKQLENQTFKDYEIILIIGDNRQGRAINYGAALANGDYLLILDDDVQLGQNDLIEKMLKLIKPHPEIGMAGVANIVPPHAPKFVQRLMMETPRRTSPIVKEITKSDLAEHPCCLIPKKVFHQIGGENELIPRGLDPYLRQEIRKAGYKVVVLPNLYIHHLPPTTFSQFIRQFYRNGKMAAYVNKFYPEFLVELAFQHNQAIPNRRTFFQRLTTYIFRLITSFVTGKIYYSLSSLLYLTGFIIGYLTLEHDDV